MKMKLYKLVAILFCVFATALISCKKGFLDLKPQNGLSPDVVWNDPVLATAFVSDLYKGLGTGGLVDKTLSSVTDETIYLHGDGGINAINSASITADNVGFTDPVWEWGSMYASIRACNIAIANLRTSKMENLSLKKRLAGEAHFMRAFYYHQMVKIYGAVPIIQKVFELTDDFTIARSTYEQCVSFIVADCDTAFTNLNAEAMEKGRANSFAALALKSRILLFAASDLHDFPTAKAKSMLIANYSNPEYLGYVTGDRIERWRMAKAAAKSLLDATTGYKLDFMAPVTTDEARANYIALSMSGGSTASGIDAQGAKDALFSKYFTSTLEGGWSNATLFHLLSGPNGYNNWSNNSPIGQLVDDYEMMDGLGNAQPFDWNNPVQSAAPYKNRDPRFYASILHDGSAWKPRGDNTAETQYGFYDLMQKNKDGVYQKITFNGLDTRKSSIEDWNGSPTGYNTRRFTDPNTNIKGQNERQYIPWVFLRYTEAIFNYAEACNALGEDIEARNWINKIRFRAGMPALNITLTGIPLRDAIRHEKRIEMAFEDQRYFDIRRWMIAPAVTKNANAVGITGVFKPGMEQKDKYWYNESVYNYTYTPLAKADQIYIKTWADKLYFRPIHRDEMFKNTLLKNNPGY